MEKIKLDDNNTYYINKDVIIIESSNVITPYTRSDLVDFYSIHQGPTILDRNNNYIIHKENNILFIPLYNNNGHFLEYTYTDLQYIDVCSKYTWNIYVKDTKKYVINSNKYVYMHEIIFGRKAFSGKVIDHKNSNGLDNRLSELRENTRGGNSHNVIKRKGCTSNYHGVSWNSTIGLWGSAIQYNGVNHFLGNYSDIIDAIIIRDIYSVHFYKDKANLNKNENGDTYISLDLINDIIKNGVPVEYEITKKEHIKKNNLPECIYT